MGVLGRLFGKRDYSVSVGRDITGSNIHLGDVFLYTGGDGRECPFNWVISGGTCGCCPKLHVCKEGRDWKESLYRNMSG